MNHTEILDGLIREIDALQSTPLRHIARIAREWVILLIKLHKGN